MRLSSKIKMWLAVASPVFWMSNQRTNYVWDDWLTANMSKIDFTTLKDHTIEINGQLVWISNYPFSFGKLYSNSKRVCDELPRKRTRYVLYKIIEEYRNRNKKNPYQDLPVG